MPLSPPVSAKPSRVQCCVLTATASLLSRVKVCRARGHGSEGDNSAAVPDSGRLNPIPSPAPCFSRVARQLRCVVYLVLLLLSSNSVRSSRPVEVRAECRGGNCCCCRRESAERFWKLAPRRVRVSGRDSGRGGNREDREDRGKDVRGRREREARGGRGICRARARTRGPRTRLMVVA